MHLITIFILDNTFSHITDYPDDSLLMCDQSPNVNDLSKILKKTVLLIQSIKYNFYFRLYIR